MHVCMRGVDLQGSCCRWSHSWFGYQQRKGTEGMRRKEEVVWEKEEEETLSGINEEIPVPTERLWEHGERRRNGLRWQEEGLRAEQGSSCWGKQLGPVRSGLGTDCAAKVQTGSNTSGSSLHTIRHFPRNWSKDRVVVQTQHTVHVSICACFLFWPPPPPWAGFVQTSKSLFFQMAGDEMSVWKYDCFVHDSVAGYSETYQICIWQWWSSVRCQKQEK